MRKKHALLIILVIAMPIFFFLYFLDRFYPNVYVTGINLTGKSKAEASALIQPKINIPESISLKYDDKVYEIPANSLDVTFDKDKTLKRAMLLGRSGNLVFDINQLFKLSRNKVDFGIEININEDYLNKVISDIAKNIDVLPQNAKFTITNNKVQSFLPEKNGLAIDINKLKNEIINAIRKNNSDKIEVEIPTQIVSPSIKTSDVNNLGLNEIIGTGISHFAGSISSRIYNINLAAARINNTLIAPDQIFSFDQAVGDISALNGYKQAYIIQDGKTILGDGGGVCQVSTTIFRTAINSGLPIIERHAHAYRVTYYEQDSEPGFDATIYTPTVDFKFKNDTRNYILIQTQIDLKNLILTFNFYGTKDGRSVNITKPTLWGYRPAPAALYTDDPTLPIGQIKQIDFAASGIKSQFEYTVTKDGEIINKQTFFSNFTPWQAKFLRGTKI